LGNNDAHIMTMVLKGCSEPPSEVAPGISEALDLVVMRGLSVDPSRRFRTAGEMASALEEATDLATASKIGRWVNSVAGASLADRRTQVAAIESQSWVPPEDAVGLIRATGSVDALPLTETEGSSGGIPTQISGITAVPSPQAVATSMGPRTAEIVGLGSMAILASLTAFWMLRSSGASPPPRAASQPDFIAEPTPSSSAPVAVETASAPVPEPRPTASVSVAAPPPTPTATHPSPAHTPAPPARNCNPNFVMDREGNKLFKPECFRQ
jgi:serine/threonine-protein kinase